MKPEYLGSYTRTPRLLRGVDLPGPFAYREYTVITDCHAFVAVKGASSNEPLPVDEIPGFDKPLHSPRETTLAELRSVAGALVLRTTPEKCPDCKKGRMECDYCVGVGKIDCCLCDGTGRFRGETCDRKSCDGGKEACSECEHGTYKCEECDGTTVVSVPRKALLIMFEGATLDAHLLADALAALDREDNEPVQVGRIGEGQLAPVGIDGQDFRIMVMPWRE